MEYKDTSDNGEKNNIDTADLPDEVGETESRDLPDEIGENESDNLPEEVDSTYQEGSMLSVLNKRDSSETENKDNNDVKEEAQVVKNKRDGCERENKVEEELKEKYPESEGYQIVKEAYLRDENGNFVIDPVTGKRRRIDFIVVKDGKVVDSLEVTSMTAPKEEQLAKEDRIREQGGNYIYDNNGNLVEFPEEIRTHVERRP